MRRKQAAGWERRDGTGRGGAGRGGGGSHARVVSHAAAPPPSALCDVGTRVGGPRAVVSRTAAVRGPLAARTKPLYGRVLLQFVRVMAGGERPTDRHTAPAGPGRRTTGPARTNGWTGPDQRLDRPGPTAGPRRTNSLGNTYRMDQINTAGFDQTNDSTSPDQRQDQQRLDTGVWKQPRQQPDRARLTAESDQTSTRCKSKQSLRYQCMSDVGTKSIDRITGCSHRQCRQPLSRYPQLSNHSHEPPLAGK